MKVFYISLKLFSSDKTEIMHDLWKDYLSVRLSMISFSHNMKYSNTYGKVDNSICNSKPLSL